MPKFLKPKQIIVFIFFTIILPSIVMAQPGFDDDVLDVPVDGGLTLLLVSGAAYGINKIRKNQTKNLK